MADGNVVGSIKVRVKPDLERFREELEAKLEAIEDSLVGELDFNGNFKRLRSQAAAAVRNMPEAEIDADLNTAGLAAQARAALAGAGAKLDVDADFRKSSLRDLMGTLNNARAQVDRTFRDAAQGLIVKISAEVDPIKRPGWRKEIESELAAMQAVAFPVDLKLDSDFGDRLRARFALEKLSVPVEVNVRPGWFQRLKAFVAGTKLTVPVEVDVDRGRASAALATLGSRLRGVIGAVGEFGSGIARAIPSLLNFRVLIALAAVAIALLIPPLLALASGLITIIPGALAGILVPIGAIALGLDGITAAAKKVEPQFQALRKTMADSFEAGFTPVLQTLADKLIPKLQDTLPRVSEGLSAMAKGVADTLTSPGKGGGLERIGNIVTNIGDALKAATPGVQSFTDGLLTLVDRTVAKFPNLSRQFNELGTRFTNWITEITTVDPSTGVSKFDTALSNLKATLGEIGGFLKDVFLQGFNDLSNPTFGDKMRSFFADVRSFIVNTLPALSTGFQKFSDALNSISPALDNIGDALETFNEVGDAMDKLNKLNPTTWPGLKQLWNNGNPFGERKFRAKSGSFWDMFMGYMGFGPDAKGGAEKAKSQVQQEVAQVVDAAKNQFQLQLDGAANGTAAVGGLASGLGESLKTQFSAEMAGVITAAQQQIATLGPGLQTALDGALVPLQQVPQKIGFAFGTIAPSVQAAFNVVTQIVTASLQQATTAFQGFQNTVSGVWAFIGMAISTGGANALASIQNTFGQIPARITAALQGAVQAVTGAGARIVISFQGSLTQIPAIAEQAFTPLATAIQTAMSTAVTSVQTGVEQITAECSQIGGKVAAAVGDLSGTLQPAGQQLAAGLRAGLESGMAGVLDYARTIAGQIAAVKGPLPKDRKELVPAGIALMDGLNAGMENGMVSVLDNAKAMAKSIFEAFKEVFGTSPNLTLNFNGMGAGFSAADTQLQKLNTTVSTFKDNIQTTPLLGTDSNTSGSALSKSEAKKQIDALSQSLLELEIQRKNLQLQKDAVGGDKAARAAIQAQINQISNQKTQLGLQKDQLNYAMKYGGVVDDTQNSYKSLVDSLLRAPVDIGQTIASSVMGDLGMSGQGAIPQLFQQGINYVFQVANMDDALGAQQVLQNRQSIGMVGR